MNILTVFYQMVTFFLFIIIGVLCSRKGIVNESNAKCISTLIIQIFNPALIFSSVLSNSQNMQRDNIKLITLIAIGMFAILIFIGHVISRLFSENTDENKVYKLMTVFSNLGFIGIPLVKSVYGTSALIYVAIFILIYNVLIYTYGISVLQDSKVNFLSIDNFKNIINTGTLSCLITLLVFNFNIPISPIISSMITYLGNATTPLALMAIGFSLEKSDISTIFMDKKIYLFSFIKLIIVPIAGVVILKNLHIQGDVLGVSVIMLTMPLGNMPVLLANKYGISTDICSQGIIITTLLSVITVPLVVGMI